MTPKTNPSLEAFEEGLDQSLQEFIQEYEHGLEAAKAQGHNTEYHTFDSQVGFKEAIMQQARALVAGAERTAENYGRVAALKDLFTWLKLHDIEDVSMVQDYVNHVEKSIEQSPNQRYVPHPELNPTTKGQAEKASELELLTARRQALLNLLPGENLVVELHTGFHEAEIIFGEKVAAEVNQLTSRINELNLTTKGQDDE